MKGTTSRCLELECRLSRFVKVISFLLYNNIGQAQRQWIAYTIGCFFVTLACQPVFDGHCEGTASDETDLCNYVYQWNGLGPSLWNMFYAEAFEFMRLLRFVDVVLADHFNAWKTSRGGIGPIQMQSDWKD